MTGWIKLHRELLEWEWYSNVNAKTVFLHCLLRANTEKREWMGRIIERGEFISSLRKMASDVGLSEKEVRNALKNLNKTGEIVSKGANTHTHVTICKYDTYQVLENIEGKQRGKRKEEQKADEGQTGGKRGATNKEQEELLHNSNELCEYTPEQIEKFDQFQKWIAENAPRVSMLKEPFTIAQYISLTNQYTHSQIYPILLAMHNRNNLCRQYVSANLTLRKWIKREDNQPVKSGRPH